MNRAAFGYFFVGYLFILLQTSLLPESLPAHLKPDLLLILIVYIGLVESYVRGGILAYVLGSLFDVFAGHYLGLYGFALLVIFLLVRGTVDRFNTENSILIFLMVFVGTFVEGWLLIFSLKFFAEAGPIGSVIFWRLFPQSLVNLIATFLLLRMCALCQRRFPRRVVIPGLQNLK